MFKKNGLFLGCLVASAFIAAAAPAETVDIIRAEDAALLNGIAVNGDEGEKPVLAEERVEISPAGYQARDVLSAGTARQAFEDEKKEWFNPDKLPTNVKKAEERASDVLANEYRLAVNACMDDVKERLYMERELFESGGDSLAFLSQTMAEINLCYEDLGREIIERYYGNDRTMKRDFSKKTETFYISGTGVDLNPEFCGENCSMSNILDAQMHKFGEFRIYLYQLLDNIPGSR